MLRCSILVDGIVYFIGLFHLQVASSPLRDVMPPQLYTRTQLLSLRRLNNGAKQLDRLKAHGILRYRGSRAGRASKRHIESSAGECQQQFGDLNKIEVIASNLRPIPKCKQTTRPRILKEIEIIDASLHHAGVWNARSINNKHGFVNELITSSEFDFFGVVETFHEDRNTPLTHRCNAGRLHIHGTGPYPDRFGDESSLLRWCVPVLSSESTSPR